MGVASGCGYQEVGVVSGWHCKEVHVYRFPHISIPTPLVLALFCSSIPTSLFIFKCFFRSYTVLCAILTHQQYCNADVAIPPLN